MLAFAFDWVRSRWSRQSAMFFYILNIAAVTGTIVSAQSATLYRAINLNGIAIQVGEYAWEGDDAKHVMCNGNRFQNNKVTLIPKTVPALTSMIQSSRWGQEMQVDISEVPNGDYWVGVYAWEDSHSTTYSMQLNGREVESRVVSGAAGQWQRLGPYPVTVDQSRITISARGGDANLSGIEIWHQDGSVPSVHELMYPPKISAESLAFFESRIRPLLIENCYACHSREADEIGGNFVIDSRAGLVRGGDGGAVIVPGDPDSSRLILAVQGKAENLQMPPDDPLEPHQIADLRQWISVGAPDPRIDDTTDELRRRREAALAKAKDFWSLKPLTKSSPPRLGNPSQSPIDDFITKAQIDKGIQALPPSDPQTLIRRATFDLIGLPPTAKEVEAFVTDPSPDAYASLIDRLLQSPQYGERWGRYWLDVVRYSDTAGDNSDFPIPQMVRFRNWVIDAFNRDLPYDQFVTQQLAGDLLVGSSHDKLSPDQVEQLIATGYLAGARRFGSRVDDYPWHLTIEDTIDNLGKAFLATTINCARCHDHKFDPVTTEDYYALYGIFASTRYPWPGIELEQRQRDLVALAPDDEVQRFRDEHRKHEKELNTKIKDLEKRVAEAKEQKSNELDELEQQVRDSKQELAEWVDRPMPFEELYAVTDAAKAEDAAVQIKGNPAQLGPVVARRFLSVLGGQMLAPKHPQSGRLELARWITDPHNPLTSRVIVNRVWQYHFGKAIVPTPNDFGRQGKPPTHPELLDWLAQRLIDGGWSIKALHREIMLSETYQRSSRNDSRWTSVNETTDPSNDLYWAYPRHRLDAEAIRDTLHYLGQSLDTSPGEAHPFPPQRQWKFTQHNPFKAVYESQRRSVYLMTQRIQRHPYLAVFDGADPAASTPTRLVSTTPLQALYLLNDPLVHESAERFAAEIVDGSKIDSERITRCYLSLFARPPQPEEMERLMEFIRVQTVTTNGSDLVSDVDPGVNRTHEIEAYTSMVRSLFRTNEFLYLD